MRVYYCYQIGSTFVSLGLMESTIIDAMATCDRIKLAKALLSDSPAWQRMVEKHSQLQSSTLGNLIGILSKHGVNQADLNYLRWVKRKRDFFVHRFFVHGAWPGELPEDAIRVLCRRLLYLEHIFRRAGHRIWRIFGRADLMEVNDLGEDGAIIMNIGTLEDEGWLKELAFAAVRQRAKNRQ